MSEYNFNIKKGKDLHIYCISDWHIGNPCCDYDFIEYIINFIKDDPNPKLIFGGGDLLEVATSKIPSSAFGQDLNVNNQLDLLINYLKPLKKHIIGLVPGNHDGARIKKDFDLDICKILATVLDCEYNIGGLYQQITVNNKKLSVYVTHGKGSSSRDELALGKVKRETNHISADINFYGHLHRTCYISDVYYINQEYKRKYYILTGSTLNYKSSYAEENGLKPIPMGFSRVNVDYNGKISVDCFNHDELNIMDQTNDGFSVDFNLEESSDYNYNFPEFKNKFNKSLSRNRKSLPVATRKKISNTMSESLNKSGYYRVSKKKNNKLKQGFTYRYQYYDEDGYHKCLSSKSLTKLEAKVKEHGLEWRKLQ